MIQDSRPLIRVVAGVVLNRDGDYLLSSRPEGKPYAGYWEFAGGKVESSESELDALDDEVLQAKKRMLAECGRLLDEVGDAAGAVQQVRALMFVARFAQDVERRRDQLGQ